MSAGTNAAGVRLWVPGDWNGFFGLFTNVLLNVIVLTGLCLGVVQLPADTVFGRILPALGGPTIVAPPASKVWHTLHSAAACSPLAASAEASSAMTGD
jgi:AGZA family xanthine/uracil permease-like MFS transporter